MSHRSEPEAHPILRDVSVHELERILRACLGLPPTESERADEHLRRVDAEAWIAWAVAGCRMFSERPRPLLEARLALESAIIRSAMRRHGGNRTHAAAHLRMSRRAIREMLTRAEQAVVSMVTIWW